MGGAGVLSRARPPQTKQAQHVVDFVRHLTHTKGEYAGQKFRLRKWQESILRELFGRIGPDGFRQYRTCYLEIPRKNGKTELAAAIALYLTMGDHEPGAEVYGAAVDRDQASLVFHAAETMVRNDRELNSLVEIIRSQRRILHPASGSLYRAIPGDAPSAHGYNAHGIVYDELHAAPNRDLWDVLTTSTGARRQPLTLVITTAGFDKHSICWELHDYAEKLLAGVLEDPTFLPIIYKAPDDADWRDERVWHIANPALGDFRSLAEMRAFAHKAEGIPALQNTFRRLYLNQWTESETRWLDGAAWAACAGPVSWDRMADACAGRRAWLGLDLSSNHDLTAAAVVCPDDLGWVDVVMHFWLPEENLRDRVTRDRVPYDQWQRIGALTLTPGNVVDYGFIRAWVKTQAARYRLQEINLDPWNAKALAADLTDDGATCVEISQAIGSVSAPTKQLEQLVKTGKIRHGGHPVLAWNAANVVVRLDGEGNYKADKKKSTERIDGIAAIITALARAAVDPGASKYERGGLLIIR